MRQGKVRYVGCSNLPAWQLVDASWTAHHHGLAPFLSTQAELSLLARDNEAALFPDLTATGMTLLPYFLLASGLLTGKYRKGAAIPADSRYAMARFQARLTDERMDRTEKLIALAERRGHTVLELAMSWLAAQPLVSSIIAGATGPEQIAANVAAVGWKLTSEDLAEVDAVTNP